jgi:hypothetical protein
VRAESVGDTSVIVTPTLDIFIGICPEQITQQTCIRYISRPWNLFDLLQTPEFRRKSSMHAQNLLINEGSDRQAVKAICECLP